MSNVKLDISWEIDEEKRLENMIIETAKAALELEGAKCDVDLSVVVTDNENIREINNEQRNIDRATDVLSFPGYEKDEWNELKKNEELVYIGDIVISKEKVIFGFEDIFKGICRHDKICSKFWFLPLSIVIIHIIIKIVFEFVNILIFILEFLFYFEIFYILFYFCNF